MVPLLLGQDEVKKCHAVKFREVRGDIEVSSILALMLVLSPFGNHCAAQCTSVVKITEICRASSIENFIF